MTRFSLTTTLLPMLAWALAGCGKGQLQGTVVDAVTDKPLEGLTVVANTTEGSGLSCNGREAVTDENGKFVFEGLCEGSGYRFDAKEGDPFWFVGDELAAGDRSTTPALKLWVAPIEDGVYELAGLTLRTLNVDAQVVKHTLLNDEAQIRSPGSVPVTPHRIAPGEFILVKGTQMIERLELLPLVAAEGHRFGSDQAWEEMQEWWYVATAFDEQGQSTRVDAKLNEERIFEAEKDDNKVRYYAHDAVEPGRYSLLGPEDSEMFIIEMGAKPTPEDEEAAAQEAEGEASAPPPPPEQAQ